jgi:uncharacterized protein YktB (UPF0637 family)
MEFKGFTEADFDVFKVDGLEARMKELIAQVRPKLEALGDYFSPVLTALTGEEFFPHVAKHARRSVHPPKDTWVAFANNRRGYKKHPHFQIGLWEDHIFVWFAIINEAVNKSHYAHILKQHLGDILAIIPDHFVWSIDHTKPDTQHHFDAEMLDRLAHVKKAELLCGITLTMEEAVGHPNLLKEIEEVFTTLSPLYEWVVKTPVTN